MQDPAGFLRYPRQAAEKQHVKARVRHWHEYEQTMPDTQARCQARRCMDCGTPWCHDYCPVHNLIPDWNDLVTEADWYVAWQCLESTNNFPEFTGRICNAPCEAACTLSIGSHPVTIRCIELAIAEHAWPAGWVKPQRSVRRLPHQVAIIGSGPAGLACAQQLARRIGRAACCVTAFRTTGWTSTCSTAGWHSCRPKASGSVPVCMSGSTWISVCCGAAVMPWCSPVVHSGRVT
jgi:glutamate synthase (NADPH/NADH) small chain